MDIKSRDSRKKSGRGDKYPPSIAKSTQFNSSERKNKKKKSKKQKKRKKTKRSDCDSDSSSGSDEWVEESKRKKHKKSKKSKRSESDTDSSSISDEWAEKDLKDEVVKPKSDARDEWMSMPGLFPCVVKEKKQPVKREDSEKMILDAMGQSKYELNPYWKDGGTGLPSISKSDSSDNVKSSGGGTVGDQGANWLRRALTRAEEQARSEGRSLEAVAAERWGSLEKLQSMLAEAEKKATDTRPFSNNRPRHHDSHRQDPERKRDDLGRRVRDGDRRYDELDKSRARRDDRQEQTKRERDVDFNRSSERSRGFHKPRGDDEDDAPSERFRRPDDREERYSSSNRRDGGSGWRKKESKPAEKPSSSSARADSRPQRSTDHSEKETKPSIPAPSRETTKVNVAIPSKVTAAKQPLSEDSDSESSNDEPKTTEVVERLSDKEMNELGAKLVKAEILGNQALAAELRARLEAARSARASAPARPSDETVLLTVQDAAGNVRPARGLEKPAGKQRKQKPAQTHDRDGNRERYFPDDDQRTLKDMFEREKMSSVEDSNKQFLDMVAKVKPSDELDAAFEDKASRQRDPDEHGRALAQAKATTTALGDCQRCYHGKRLQRHLVVAAGEKAYLCVPGHRSLTSGHCMIVPVNHAASAVQLDEDVWAEMQLFRRGLAAMFAARDEDVVFFETATRLRHRPHMLIECVPLPRDEGAAAPIYFKKAILECETEWSTNHKLVDTRKTGVRRCLPRELPYFAVDFGTGGGFAHVIEDEKAFPDTFAQEVVAGMLDLDHDTWRKPAREPFEKQRDKVLQLSSWFKPHDFTATLSDGGDST